MDIHILMNQIPKIKLNTTILPAAVGEPVPMVSAGVAPVEEFFKTDKITLSQMEV